MLFYTLINVTKNGTLLIDKAHFATYPRACDQALATQAAGEVPAHYASHSPALQWDNGPSCGVAAGGSEIICSGSEDDGGSPVGGKVCEIYLYKPDGGGPDFVNDYPGLSCYDDEP